MTILIIASAILTWATEGKDPHDVSWMLDLCNYLRTIGFMGIVVYMVLYESFHKLCLKERRTQMARAGLLEGMHFSSRCLKRNLVDYAMAPICAPLYGSVPSVEAQISHFWTLDLVYAVSGKATRKTRRPVTAADAIA